MKQYSFLSSSALATLAVVAVFVAQAAPRSNRGAPQSTINVSTYPPDVQRGFRVFADKCSECHALSLSLNVSRSEAGWTQEVRRMQDMASSHIDDREAGEITKFLAYYDAHKPSEKTGTSSADGVPSGKDLFDKLSCSACHSIAGAGNTSFPLDGIGSRRTASELKKQIQSPAAGSAMPATMASEAEIDSLVSYLVTLKSR
jgi:mono/diheme cytochrome c family protein